jgi:hypothetical protein
MKDQDWKSRLTAEMKKTRKALLRSGTVAMSRQNFWQVVRIPQNGGPVGTNAAYTARQIFDSIIDNDRYLRQFTY